jgi:hypothetical protein
MLMPVSSVRSNPDSVVSDTVGIEKATQIVVPVGFVKLIA